MDRRLVVIEKDNAYWVTWEGDSDDWLVIFFNKEGFPARQWAERMVYLYNHGSRGNEAGLPKLTSSDSDAQGTYNP